MRTVIPENQEKELPSKSSIYQRATRGGFWVFTLRICTHLLGVVRLVVLARLLAPSDFGLFGIAILAITSLETGCKSRLLVTEKQSMSEKPPSHQLEALIYCEIEDSAATTASYS